MPAASRCAATFDVLAVRDVGGGAHFVDRRVGGRDVAGAGNAARDRQFDPLGAEQDLAARLLCAPRRRRRCRRTAAWHCGRRSARSHGRRADPRAKVLPFVDVALDAEDRVALLARVRTVVVPRAATCARWTAMRSASSPSVSFCVSSIAAPGSSRPRWVCMFIRPGASHLPGSRISRAPAGTGTWPAGPTAVMRSPVITTTAFMTGAPSRFATLAPVITRTGGGGGGASFVPRGRRRWRRRHLALAIVAKASVVANSGPRSRPVAGGARGAGETSSSFSARMLRRPGCLLRGDASRRQRLEYRSASHRPRKPGCPCHPPIPRGAQRVFTAAAALGRRYPAGRGPGRDRRQRRCGPCPAPPARSRADGRRPRRGLRALIEASDAAAERLEPMPRDSPARRRRAGVRRSTRRCLPRRAAPP